MARQRFAGPIHERVATARDTKGITQEQLASMVGVDKTAVSHWESGVSRPDVTNLPKLAEALGVSVTTLLRDLLDNTKRAA